MSTEYRVGDQYVARVHGAARRIVAIVIGGVRVSSAWSYELARVYWSHGSDRVYSNRMDVWHRDTRALSQATAGKGGER